MKAAIYVASLASEAFEAEIAQAKAFCADHGLEPVRIYRGTMVQDKAQVDAFLRAARTDAFGVVVAPFPDCFSTRILKGLVAAGVGLACHAAGVKRSARKP